MRHLRKFISAAAAALMLCSAAAGCSKKEEDDEYHVYSGGQILDSGAIISSENKKNSFADFYIPDGMVTDYYTRYSLSDSEKQLYDTAVKDLGRLRESVPLPADSMSYQKILDTIRLEQLSFPHVYSRELDFNGARKEFEVKFVYRLTADQISSMNIASERAAKAIMAELTPDMDDYEKLKFFHDYLILSCENSTVDIYSDTIYGTLVKKRALCEGYAKSFSYLCNLAGIENVIVTGNTTVAHMWNMVKVGGNWYHVDVTWDNPNDKLHEEYPETILYQYFMVTDSVIKNNHTIWEYPAAPPKAYGTDENYFVREGTDITTDSDLLTVSENAIKDAVRAGRKSAMIKFSTTDLYLSALPDLSDKSLFAPVEERVEAECGRNINLQWTDYYKQYRIITFLIEYENE